MEKLSEPKQGIGIPASGKALARTHLCATRGFLRICCPNRSVLKMGFLVDNDEDDPEAPPMRFDAATGCVLCPRESLSDTALGILFDECGMRPSFERQQGES